MPDGGAISGQLLGSIAAPVVGGLLGGSGSSQSGTATSTSRVEMDPRMASTIYGTGNSVLRPGVQAKMGVGTRDDYKRMLNDMHRQKYGIDIPTDQTSQDWLNNAIDGMIATGTPVQVNPTSDYATDNGIVGRITDLLDRPQNAGMAGFGTGMDTYLGQYGRGQFDNTMRAANRLQEGNIAAPTMQAAQMGAVPGMTPAQMQAAKIAAPGQNDIGLSPAFSDMIYGQPGNNPYLTGGIQKGINQSSNAFSDMLSQATRSLTQDILPSIRSGAIVNGAMGGSRQGIAEGKALQDFSTQMGQALQRFGQGNTDSAVAAQAGAYDADRNRALSALGNLSGQQYGVATTQAGLDQDANKTNAGFTQDAAKTNYLGALDAAKTNAGLQQQAGSTNLGAALDTNRLNSGNLASGISATSGLLGQGYNFGANQDAYTGQKVGQVAGLLSPFTGLGATQTSSQPLYQNQGAGILGGALAGAQLSDMVGGFGSNVPKAALNNPTVFNDMYGRYGRTF